jgi:hypothetical protein
LLESSSCFVKKLNVESIFRSIFIEKSYIGIRLRIDNYPKMGISIWHLNILNILIRVEMGMLFISMIVWSWSLVCVR